MDMVQRFAKTLALLWVDSCSVSVQEEYRKESGASGFREKLILEDEPCKLSFYDSKASNNIAAVHGPAAPLSQMAKLILRADAQIPPGSRVEIRREGKTLRFKASSQAAAYFSHQEILLEVEEEWA
ncbi:MAG: hypothetical protein J6M10_05700 [Clostridia bacterium]|nr:hypothetical protein [Clostridia bacterium]